MRCNSEDMVKKLKGFIPAVSDWHAKVSLLSVSIDTSIMLLTVLYFLQVFYKRLYKDDSKLKEELCRNLNI